MLNYLSKHLEKTLAIITALLVGITILQHLVVGRPYLTVDMLIAIFFGTHLEHTIMPWLKNKFKSKED